MNFFWIKIGINHTIEADKWKINNSEYIEENEYNLEEATGTEESSEGIDVPEETLEHEEEDEEPEPEEEIEIPPEVIKKQWAIGFAVFGLIFIMSGGIVLWFFEFEFTTFLGSCMIYVGMMSLIKGISFQIPEERVIITGFMPVLIFGINFFLLDSLLGVIGQSAWMVQTDGRKVGDLILIYILPLLMWKIVPSFSKKKSEDVEEDSHYPGYERLKNLLPQSMKFVIFTYLIFNITNNYIFIPSLRQYAKVGFDIGIYFVIIGLAIRMIITFLDYRVGNSKEFDEVNEEDSEEEYFEKEMDSMHEGRDDENLQKRDANEGNVK